VNYLSRPIELALAALTLIVSSPITALSAALVYLQDHGPVIHRRRVIGVGGREFDAFKLRTMRVDADQWLATQQDLLERFETHHKLEQDPRVTPIGRILRRFSIDELPQLVNVLRGEMSLVGPRMFHPSELPQYGDAAQEILSVPPGITGLWQVSGRQELDRAARVELDLRYVRERSLKLDLLILLKTIPAALHGRGAY
jgi:lipopolysaccharide/colanic/teichoic acid biosynthesis glycosyltransferase